MSSSRKASRYLEALQAALNTESYHEIPELSRKVRKHDPARICYARSAEVQAVLLQQLNRAQNTLDNANFNDTTRRFHWLELDAKELLPQKALLKEAYEAHKSASAEEKAFYDNTNLFYGLVVRQLDAALHLSTQISTSVDNPYALQTLTLFGILHELLNHPTEAVTQYQKVSVVDSPRSVPAGSKWLQFALYRLAVLHPSAERCEAYLKQSPHASTTSTTTRRLHVLSTRPEDMAYSEELIRTTSFPSADSINVRLLNHVTNVMEPWLSNGEDITAAERLLEMLFEAGSKTFHSPRILRYMVHVLAALQRYEEVFLALRAYLQIAIHTRKTQPGSDADSLEDIIGTIQYVVSQVLKATSKDLHKHVIARELDAQVRKLADDFVVDDAAVQDMMSEIHGFVHLLEYQSTNEKSHLDRAIVLLSDLSTSSKSTLREETLAIAHCQHGDMPSALGRIRRALSLDENSVSALLVFANLLCCEELYDRALAVLARIEKMPVLNPGITEQNIKRVIAKMMQLKIVEATEGPSRALEQIVGLLVVFKLCLGTSSPETEKSILDDSPQTANVDDRVFAEPIRPPTIRIESPAPTNSSTSLDQLATRVVPDHGTNGARLQPSDVPRSVSHPVRSASLKHSQPHKHFPHHINLRKSASVRSMRQNQPNVNGSSRSSSPMNHPEPAASQLTGADHQYVESPVASETQPTAVQVQQKKRNEMLAEIWLYIAHLCHASGAPVIDAEEAIEEARALVGQVSSVLNLQLELRLDIVKAQKVVSEDNWELIEQGYDFSLNLDDMSENTVLSFSEFLLRRAELTTPNDPHRRADRLARAYELLESLKDGPAAGNPRLWQLSGDVASKRGDLDRAEEDYWRAVESTDRVGVIDWYRLW